MNKNQGKRVLAGCAILMVILTTTAFLFFFEAIRAAFRETYSVVIIMPSAAGLREGTPVWIAGNQVGKVTTIAFRPVQSDSIASIAVTVELPAEHQWMVRTDSRVRLTTQRAIGDPLIDIAPGSRNAAMIGEYDTLYALPRPSIAEAMSNIKIIRVMLDSLMRDGEALVPMALDRQRQFTRVTDRLSVVQRELRVLTSSFSSADGSLRLLSDPGLRQSFTHLSTTSRQLSVSFSQAAARFTDPPMKSAFTALQTRAAAISAQIDSLNTVMANGSLPRFARDSAIMKALHRAQLELDSLMAVTKRNPLRFWLGTGGDSK